MGDQRIQMDGQDHRKRKKETIRKATKKTIAGFCLSSEMTNAEKQCALEIFPNASVVKISSVGVRGRKHYSTTELIGHSVKGTFYVVTDLERFNHAMSVKLETDFLKNNPQANCNIRSAFTRFMHENKLHWSMCCRKR
ncbi:MAG: hypothetical protein ACYCPW_06630 [Nitrososphaerales archaeon]